MTYEGTTNSRENSSEAVEIDGRQLPQGKAVSGLTDDQVARLEELPYHRFTVQDSDEPTLADLTKEELQAQADQRGLTVEGTGAGGNVTKDDLVRELEAHSAELLTEAKS